MLTFFKKKKKNRTHLNSLRIALIQTLLCSESVLCSIFKKIKDLKTDLKNNLNFSMKFFNN
jgi:hypothetical protein